MAFLYQIIKSLVFAFDTSACRLLLVFESINKNMSCKYRWWYSLCPMSGLKTRSLGLNTLGTT